MVRDFKTTIDHVRDVLYIVADGENYSNDPEFAKEICDCLDELDELYLLEDRYGVEEI